MKVLIAIQARSTSKRLPNKVNMLLEDTTLLNSVINKCKSAMSFINEKTHYHQYYCSFCLVIPKDDPIKMLYKNLAIIEGPEDDVLTRYVVAADKFAPDYIVRITGDCPLLPPPLITKHILTCLDNKLDYVSNVDERYRTFLDGYDVEIFSRKVLDWLDQNAKGIEREHVTVKYRKDYPQQFRTGHIVGYMDQSDLKYSVDTEEEFERVKKNILSLKDKLEGIKRLNHAIFRF